MRLRSTVALALLTAYAGALASLAFLLARWSAGPGFGVIVLVLLAFAALAALGGLASVSFRTGLPALTLAFIGGLPAQATVVVAAVNGPGLLFLAFPGRTALLVTLLWLGGALLWFAGFLAVTLGTVREPPMEFEVVAPTGFRL